jgi:hypothetical protein
MAGLSVAAFYVNELEIQLNILRNFSKFLEQKHARFTTDETSNSVDK